MIDYVAVLLIIGFIWAVAATIFDIKTKEVPNWLNFTLIIVALAYRLIHSIITSNYWVILDGLIGLGVFLIIANILYYTKAFGGGDAKLLMGLGAIIWLGEKWQVGATNTTIFIISLLVVGFLYGIIMSSIILARSKKETKIKFLKEIKNQTRKNKITLAGIGLLVIISAVTSFYYKTGEIMIITIALIIFPTLLVYTKAGEKTILTKKIPVENLRVGDWLYKDIKVGKETIKSKFDGLEEEEIKKIRKNLDHVTIRDGIPFVPAFLITYILTVVLWYSGRGFFTNLLNLI